MSHKVVCVTIWSRQNKTKTETFNAVLRVLIYNVFNVKLIIIFLMLAFLRRASFLNTKYGLYFSQYCGTYQSLQLFYLSRGSCTITLINIYNRKWRDTKTWACKTIFYCENIHFFVKCMFIQHIFPLTVFFQPSVNLSAFLAHKFIFNETIA